MAQSSFQQIADRDAFASGKANAIPTLEWQLGCILDQQNTLVFRDQLEQGLDQRGADSGDVNGAFRRDVNKSERSDAGICNDA
jgi:hypothetical protein